ncbi:uncharacterized protein FIBRA_05775 [Fibroporia radiculosa]|uniref:SHSP domain-containing protein n=1 Tax=Fibroporia radiculosa TaxID=599839 RepID=J4IAW7_9APHY|nr:uncharacterized protein FIBRA_05775 [Fibroporia radiculosa]CCM03631.1 predicted protein [Fibroporia radiculosa]
MSFSQFYYDPFAEFNRMLDDALTERRDSPSQGQLQRRAAGPVRAAWPNMDVHEDAQNNLVEATFELPGLKKEDVTIDVQNNRLTVSGESTQSTEKDDAGYAIRERRHGKFSRALQLPAGINTNDIKASMNDGVLTVVFPRAAPKEGPKKITVA